MLKRVEFDLTDREFAALEAMARDAKTSVEVMLRRAVADLLAESLARSERDLSDQDRAGEHEDLARRRSQEAERRRDESAKSTREPESET